MTSPIGPFITIKPLHPVGEPTGYKDLRVYLGNKEVEPNENDHVMTYDYIDFGAFRLDVDVDGNISIWHNSSMPVSCAHQFRFDGTYALEGQFKSVCTTDRHNDG